MQLVLGLLVARVKLAIYKRHEVVSGKCDDSASGRRDEIVLRVPSPQRYTAQTIEAGGWL